MKFTSPPTCVKKSRDEIHKLRNRTVFHLSCAWDPHSTLLPYFPHFIKLAGHSFFLCIGFMALGEKPTDPNRPLRDRDLSMLFCHRPFQLSNAVTAVSGEAFFARLDG